MFTNSLYIKKGLPTTYNAVWPRGISKQFTVFSIGYFLNWCHKTTFLKHFLKNFKDHKMMPSWPYLFITLNVACNGYGEFNNLFNQIRLQTTEISMLNGVKHVLSAIVQGAFGKYWAFPSLNKTQSRWKLSTELFILYVCKYF